MNDFLISIIVPCYNEEENLVVLKNEILEELKDYKLEIIYVNDGSNDKSQEIIENICHLHANIKFINFSRNFGQQVAIKAGIDFAKGDCIVTMDADLQHPPKTLFEMIQLWKKGFDIVNGVRIKKTVISKNVFSEIFYFLFSKMSDHDLISSGADFRLFDKKIAFIVKNMNEQNIYLRGLFSYIGFKQTSIRYIEDSRKYGKTKYSFIKMLQLASNAIMSFSVKPLRISFFLGIFFTLTSLIIFLFYIENIFKLYKNIELLFFFVAGLFLFGIQFILLGFIGEYVGKLYIENKNRPNYFIASTNIDIELK